MERYLRNKPQNFRNFILDSLSNMRVKVDALNLIEQRPPFVGERLPWAINPDNIFQTVNYFAGLLNGYIVSRGLFDDVTRVSYSLPRKNGFTQESVLILFTEIHKLLNLGSLPLPTSLTVDFSNSLKFAQRNSKHMKGFRDFLQSLGRDVFFGFSQKLARDILSSKSVNEEGANYLAIQYGVSFPKVNDVDLLSIEEKRLTLQLVEVNQMWGGTLHEFNNALKNIFRDYGTFILRFDENKKGFILTVTLQREISSAVFKYWNDSGILPPERLGYSSSMVLVNNLPIGFNSGYLNFLKGAAKFFYNPKKISLKSPDSFVMLPCSFAAEGDMRPIPDKPDGSLDPLNMSSGYGVEYEKPLEEGGAVIKRRQINWLWNKLYDNYAFYQRNSMLEWNEDASYFKLDRRGEYRVKYKGRVYSPVGDVDDKLPPDQSKSWQVIKYDELLTISDVVDVLNEYLPKGITFDCFANTIAELRKDSVFEGYETPTSEWHFSRIRLGLPKVQEELIKEHNHEVTIDEHEWEHQHNFKSVSAWPEKKYGSKGGALPFFAKEQWIVDLSSTTNDGAHSHTIDTYSSSTPLAPKHISLNKIIKNSDGFNQYYVRGERQKINLSISPKDNLLFASVDNSLTKLIKDKDDYVSWHGGFSKKFDSSPVGNRETTALEVDVFNSLVKQYTLFIRQAYSRGWVEYNPSCSYDYGCRVKAGNYIYISLLNDNNKNLSYSYAWLREDEIISKEELKNIFNKINQDLVSMVFPSFLKDRDNCICLSKMEINFKVDLPKDKDIYGLRKILNGVYGDNDDKGVYFPALKDNFIKIDNSLNLKSIKPQGYSIGRHSHWYVTTEDGKHSHDSLANDNTNLVSPFANHYSYSVWPVSFDEGGIGLEHRHHVNFFPAGVGDELYPKNISLFYYWRDLRDK